MKNRNIRLLLTLLLFTGILSLNASGTFTLIEINPLHGSSAFSYTSDSAKTFYGAGELSGFTEMNGKIYFSAQRTAGDDELWVSDGTVQGTSLVKEINPASGAGIGNLVKVGNRILFMATENGSSWNLWSTDGTEAGTIKILELNQPSNVALGANNISWIGNQLVFCTREKLLISNGTAAGTDSLLSLTNYSQGFGYCELNNKSYFILPEVSGGGNELWRTDGTTAGTVEMLDLNDSTYNVTGVNEVASFNGKIYLSASINGQPADLFVFDGNLNGQLNRIAISRNYNSNPHGFKDFNNVLYFIASNDSGFANVYSISANDSIPVALIPDSKFNSLSNLTLANGNAYFRDAVGSQIHAINLSTLAYTTLNLSGYTLANFPGWDGDFLLSDSQEIFFEAYNSSNNNQVLMQSDFTAAGTHVVMPGSANTVHPFNYQLGGGSDDVFDLKMWGNQLLLPANFTDAGRELWIFDPTTATGVSKINYENPLSIYPNPANNELVIKTNAGNIAQSVNILNTDGQIMMEQKLSGEINTINLSSLASGSYFITLIEGGKIVGTKQFLLTK